MTERMGDSVQNSDVGLMLNVKDGDIKAFDRLFSKYRHRLKSYFLCRLRHATQDRSLADDYVQEVFLKLWKNKNRYMPNGKFSSYLFSIAKRYWIDCQRRICCLPTHVSIDTVEEEYLCNIGRELRDEVEDNILSKELSEEIKIAAEFLTEKQKKVFILSEFEGMPQVEIAQVIGCAIKAVSALRQRALKNIKKRLTQSPKDCI